MSEIKPALSAEEWRQSEFARKDSQGNTSWAILGGNNYNQMVVGGYGFLEDDGRHALAALALHGQPFGFTHEDVRALQLAINGLLVHGMGYEDLVSIQTRIAALLPEP